MPYFQKGDRVTVVEDYALCKDKTGRVIKSWDEPDRDVSWARVLFGHTLDGSKLTQTIPENCLRWTVTREEWERKHEDYKGIREDGTPAMLKLTSYGTCSLPVIIVGEETG